MSSDARLQRLGLSHLANDPEALSRELERLSIEDSKAREQVQRDMETLRAKLAKDGADEQQASASDQDRARAAEAKGDVPAPAVPPATTKPRAAKGKSSTLLTASKADGPCKSCRHANRGTADFAEGHIFCQLDQQSKRSEQFCDICEQLPVRLPQRGDRREDWPRYFMYEPAEASNGTWGTLEDRRLIAEDADQDLRRELSAHLPIIYGD